jgi:hypothetical protein
MLHVPNDVNAWFGHGALLSTGRSMNFLEVPAAGLSIDPSRRRNSRVVSLLGTPKRLLA